MDSTRLRVDRIDVWQTDDEHTLSLVAAGVHVMLIRLRYDGRVDEVINGAGTVAAGPGAWTRTGHELILEFVSRADCVGMWTPTRPGRAIGNPGLRMFLGRHRRRSP
ncbi:MAG TPA: hypothetical protein VN408_14110 [Actinoplanes sp.]|nr:hypothetical protein [Actinoplanes sp.]